MFSKIKVQAPAKINLTLKVGKKRPDGFHPIESLMNSINLYDYITLEVKEAKNHGTSLVRLSSNSPEIPLDETNIAYRAAHAFMEEAGMACDTDIYIEKNIPVAAGLAGGSTDGSAVVFGLNQIFGCVLSEEKIDKILQSLGSDLNFCYTGGAKLCKGRGEKLEEAEFKPMDVTLIKPLNLKISAREAYLRFDETVEAGRVSDLSNDLEFALLEHYEEIKFLHDLGFCMSGSGPTFFSLRPALETYEKEKLKNNYLIIEGLKTVPHGVLKV